MMHTSFRSDLLSADIHLLGNILGKVIRRQAGITVFELEERIRALTKARRVDDDPAVDEALLRLVDSLDTGQAEDVARAFTTYFELINLAEEHHRVRVLRDRQREVYPQPLEESVANAIASLRNMGLDEMEVERLLKRLQVELVFTAHPTEARRRTVLSHLRRIAQALFDLERRELLPAEEEALIKELTADVTTLWLTERNRTSQPKVTDEVRTGLYYFDITIWQVLPEIYRATAAALAQHYPDLQLPPRFLTFGSWIGGDRDGNPNVTAEVTAETLRLHRGLAVERHRGLARELSRYLSLSYRLTPVTQELLEALQQVHLSPHATYLQERYPNEPYRLLAAALAEELAQASSDDVAGRLLQRRKQPLPNLRTMADLIRPLSLIHRSLAEAGAGDVADADLDLYLRQVQLFGLHVARLDIRQFSDDNTAVLDELLRNLDLCENFTALSRPDRTELLTRLLAEAAPDLDGLNNLSAAAADTLDLFRALCRAVTFYGPELIGPYIVSMTHGPEDILAPMLLAYGTGLCLRPDGGPEMMTFCPLFETRSDLRNAAVVMKALFDNPAYARHLDKANREQTIMIGYSDSNKDAGYVTAQWELFQAQASLAAACREVGVVLTLFHGRGGTIARGGGPANRAILAQPPGSVGGRIRITEQGEVIDERYGHPEVARRHLEQVVHAALMASVPQHDSQAAPQAAWLEAMEEIAAAGYGAYRGLVYETPELLDYWNQATPIREISQLRIGSRPSRRATSEAFTSLRAIPWGFSWMQCRHVLPGWYGLGSALESYGGRSGGLGTLRAMYRDWSFFRTTIDNAQVSLGKADMGIARLYAGLVEEEEVREPIFSAILAEYQRASRWILRVTEQREILDNEPVLQRSVRLRNPYVDPLNFIQVTLLRRLRALSDPEGAEAQPLLQAIFLTINGIAAGLKNTG
jgi:phosphoenolpyruvate carboxylase